jgi:hypothetical protein
MISNSVAHFHAKIKGLDQWPIPLYNREDL